MKIARIAGLLLTVGTLGLGACSNNGSVPPSTQGYGISLSTTSRDLMVGDMATVTVNDTNTYGRDTKIEWSTTGGKINPQEHGRIATVQFDTPGDYTVWAKLFVNGQEVRRDSVSFNVKARM